MSLDDAERLRDFWQTCYNRRYDQLLLLRYSVDAIRCKMPSNSVVLEQEKWMDEAAKKCEHAREMLQFFEDEVRAARGSK